MSKKKEFNLRYVLVALSISISAVLSFGSSGLSPVSAESTPYSTDIASKLVTRCDLIKDYLSKTVRINELATRQNKVRGWEYILRQLDDLQDNYGRFSVDYSELSANIAPLRQQLEQFKVDFEAYDREFQKLLNTDCRVDPGGFWAQLDTVKSFRSGITLSSDNYKASLLLAISKEEAKW